MVALSIVMSPFALPSVARANGADLPPEIVIQAFLKVEGSRARMLVRAPLILLSSFSLPKRGPGYLDLANLDPKLMQVAAATGRQIQLAGDDGPLDPSVRAARISALSDHSFQGYETALANTEGPRLPVDTELFWNQGFFDTELDYALPAPDARLRIRVNVAPELERRLKVRLVFFPSQSESRRYELSSAPQWIALDPRWYEAAWLSIRGGFVDAWRLDRFLFLLCVAMPFRRYLSVLAVVVVMVALQVLSSTATAAGFVAPDPWVGPAFDTALAAALLALAIGNLAAPSLRRRWVVAALIGGLGGFGLGYVFMQRWQFAGTHGALSSVAYCVGAALGTAVMLGIAIAALRTLFRFVLGETLGIIIASALIGLVGWQWMMESVHRLHHATESGVPLASIIEACRWMVPAVIVGITAWLLPRSFGGEPLPTLRSALLERRSDQGVATTRD